MAPPDLDPELQRLLSEEPLPPAPVAPAPAPLGADEATRVTPGPPAPLVAPAAVNPWETPGPVAPPSWDSSTRAEPGWGAPVGSVPARAGGGAGPESLDFADLFSVPEGTQPSRRVEAIEYVVRGRDGVVQGPFDQVTLRAHLQTRRLHGTEECSTDGGISWKALSVFPEFADVIALMEVGRENITTDLARVESAPVRQRSVEILETGRHGLATPAGASLDQARSAGLGEAQRGSLDGAERGGIEGPRPWAPAAAEDRSPGEYGAFSPSIAAAAPSPSPAAPSGAAVERPSWLAPAVTEKGGRSFADALKAQRRRRLVLYSVSGLVLCGGLGFFLLWDPGFEGEEAIRKKITLDEAQVKRHVAQARVLMLVGNYRAYAEARTRLASVVRHDPKDHRSKSLYLQALLYLIREYGQTAISKEAEKLRKELDRAGERDLEFQKAKVSYALWKRDRPEALRYLDRILAAEPEDREALFLKGVALSETRTAPQAVTIFDKLLGMDPKSVKYLRARGEALLLVDQEAGILALRKVLEVAPSDAGASLRLAEIYLDAGRREDAKRLFLWVVDPRASARREASPDELARAYTFLGRIAYEDRDFKMARQYLEAALPAASSELERAHALSTLGDVLVAEREYKLAIERLELAKQKTPDNPDVLARLAVAYVLGGQSGKARQSVQEALKILRARRVEELLPREKARHRLQEATARLASATVNVNDEIPRLGEAVDDYRAAMSIAESVGGAAGKGLLLRARVELASLLRRQKNLGGALNELEAARKIADDSAAVHNGFGEVFADQGQAKKAEEAYRKALALDPRFLKAGFNLAELLSEQGRLEEALKHFDAVAKVDPNYPGLNLAMAISYQRQKRYTEAIDAFERAVKASPDDPRVYLRIGIAYFELGGSENLGKARTYLDRAIEKNRQLNEAYYYRGRVLLALKKPESALDDFKTACEREADNGVYRIYWGWAYEQTNSYRDAMFQYNRAIELLREQRNEVDIAFALYRRGRLRLERDETRSALKDLEDALKYDAANTEVQVLLGESLAQAGQHQKAVERYRAALARGSKVKGLWFKLGRSLLEVNQRAEAARAFLRAAEEDPGDCYPHYYLGYIYKDQRREAEAVRALKRFLSLCKEAPERKDVGRDIYDMERRLGLVKE
jgi:tetratricopeptide (TPR) repeat protein